MRHLPIDQNLADILQASLICNEIERARAHVSSVPVTNVNQFLRARALQTLDDLYELTRQEVQS